MTFTHTSSTYLSIGILIAPTVPTLLELTPADGAVGVEGSAKIVLRSSEAIERNSVSAQSVVVSDAAGQPIPGVFSFSPDGATVTFYPDTDTVLGTVYLSLQFPGFKLSMS